MMIMNELPEISSPPCRTVQMVAKQLNIELNLKHIDYMSGEHLSPEFIKLNPAHTIPTINDNGFALCESRAICRYLCDKYSPGTSLYPKELESRAIVERVLDFDIGALTMSVVHAVIEPMRGSVLTDEQTNALKNRLQLLNTLIGDNGYVAGNHLTIADLSILSMLTFLISVDYDLSDYPNVKQWLSKLQAELPYFEEINRKVIDEFPALMEQMRKAKEEKKQ